MGTYGVESNESPMWVDVFPRNWVSLIPEHQCSLDGQVHDHKSLRSQLVRENLERVCDEEARPGKCVEDAEEPDEDDLGIPSGLHVIGHLESGSSDGPCQKHQAHARGRGQEEWSSSHTINKESTANTNNQTHQGLAAIELRGIVSNGIQTLIWKTYRNLLALFCNAHAVINKTDIIAEESISRVLGNDTERDEESQSVSIALGPHEIQIAAGLLVFEFESQGFLNLTEFERNSRVLFVAISVVFGEDVLGFIVAFLGDVPTRRFWNPVYECKLDNGRQALEKSKSSPRPTIWDCAGGPGNPGND